jgi:hypothetical protein
MTVYVSTSKLPVVRVLVIAALVAPSAMYVAVWVLRDLQASSGHVSTKQWWTLLATSTQTINITVK